MKNVIQSIGTRVDQIERRISETEYRNLEITQLKGGEGKSKESLHNLKKTIKKKINIQTIGVLGEGSKKSKEIWQKSSQTKEET